MNLPVDRLVCIALESQLGISYLSGSNENELPVASRPNSEVRILVVDDDRSTRLMLQAALEGRGFQVTLAADGVEGLEQIRKNKFEVLISDLHMPGVDGREVVKVAHGTREEILDNVYNTLAFQRASSQPNTPIFVFPEGLVTSESVVAFAFSRHILNECVGVVVGQVPIHSLTEQLILSDEHSNSVALFTNERGEILAHTEAAMIGRLVPEATLQKAVIPGSDVTHRMEILGQDAFVAMSPVPTHGYTSLIVCPIQASLAGPHRVKEQAAIILIVFMCVAYIVSMIMASNLSRPIMRLAKIAQQGSS